jgi:hypothetical protein
MYRLDGINIDKEPEFIDKVSLAGNCFQKFSIVIVFSNGEVHEKPFWGAEAACRPNALSPETGNATLHRARRMRELP